ncbi:cell division protein FtsQ [Aurantimicrobium minutum]|uniref:FtsQ-type POTRA domain-containing protein n=1 Tax=Aurantimicrobium minutum TaxID=708131 RepID=UPI00247406D7|nr:FtsQ-type POTRA domain-containing protein [Aurantimicrobium minutum]MDH6533123.1 cell division protein FtsQ [Aurantimicrobium minutum]
MKRPQGPAGSASSLPSRAPQRPVQPGVSAKAAPQAQPAQAPKTPKPPRPAKAPKPAKTRKAEKKAQRVTAASSTEPTSRIQGTRRPIHQPPRPVPLAPRAEAVPEKKVREKSTPRLTKVQRDAAEAKLKLKEAVKARKAFERDEVRRFTAHLRRRRVMWLSITGSLVAVLIFVGIGVFTPILALQTITVEGAARVPADQIVTALQPEMNKPLPLVNMDSVRKAVEAQPLVKSYSTVASPPHTLVIKIVERSPIGYVPSATGFTMVDPAGVVMENSEERIPGIPLFTVEGDSTQSPGFRAGVDVLESLPSSLAGQVDQVIAKTTDDVTLVLTGGARVFWGGPENAAFKNHVLSKLLAVNPVGSVSEYDVSSPKTAVVR